MCSKSSRLSAVCPVSSQTVVMPRSRSRFRVRADESAHLPTLGASVADRAGASLAAMLGKPPAEVTVVMEVRHERRRAETGKRRVE